MRLIAPVPSAWTKAGLSTAAPISAMAECFKYEAIRLENIGISLHCVTTAFKTSGQGTTVIAGLLIKLRHLGRVPLVIALLHGFRLLLALRVGNRARGTTQNRSTDGPRTRITRDDGANDRSSHRSGDSVATGRRHGHHLH